MLQNIFLQPTIEQHSERNNQKCPETHFQRKKKKEIPESHAVQQVARLEISDNSRTFHSDVIATIWHYCFNIWDYSGDAKRVG